MKKQNLCDGIFYGGSTKNERSFRKDQICLQQELISLVFQFDKMEDLKIFPFGIFTVV